MGTVPTLVLSADRMLYPGMEKIPELPINNSEYHETGACNSGCLDECTVMHDRLKRSECKGILATNVNQILGASLGKARLQHIGFLGEM